MIKRTYVAVSINCLALSVCPKISAPWARIVFMVIARENTNNPYH